MEYLRRGSSGRLCFKVIGNLRQSQYKEDKFQNFSYCELSFLAATAYSTPHSTVRQAGLFDAIFVRNPEGSFQGSDSYGTTQICIDDSVNRVGGNLLPITRGSEKWQIKVPS